MKATGNTLSASGNKLPSRFGIGGWTVDSSSCYLSRGEKTLKLEPKVMEVLVFLATRPGEVVSRDALEEALPLAYFVAGLSYRETGEYVKALVEAEKAIRYDPNYANAHVLLATLLYYAGRPEEGLERIKKAMLLNPHHPYNYTFHLGQAYYILRRYDEAIETFQQGLASNPASERLHVWLAAAYAQAGISEKSVADLGVVTGSSS